MKLYFTPKTLKKIIRLLLLFILISIIIFYSKSLNVQAKEFDYTFTSPYFYFLDQELKSSSGYSNLVDSNIFYYIPSDNNNRQSIRNLSYEINFKNISDFKNSFSNDDLVYFKAIILFHSKFDVSKIENFSFNSNLATKSENFYNLYFVYGSSDFSATIEDFDTYITIDSLGEYAYNEVLLFSLAVPYSKVSTLSSFRVGLTSQDFSNTQIVEYGKTHGTIPTTNKNSFMQINQLVISDEEIIMDLEDFKDPLNLDHYSPNELIFPDYEEDIEDDSILGFIKRIFNKILDIFKFIIKIPLIIGEKIVEAFINAFVPDDDFFKNAWESNFQLLEDKLGFLFLPISILEEVLKHFLNLGNGSGIIHIPTIKDPFYSQTLISAQDFNLKQIFSTGAIGTVHNVYLVVVDILIVVALITLSWKKFNSIFKGGQE